MHTFYILQSLTSGKFYIGQSDNIQTRIREHNSGKSSSTKSGIPWIVVYSEEYNTRAEALQRERKIKSLKSRKSIKRLIEKSKALV